MSRPLQRRVRKLEESVSPGQGLIGERGARVIMHMLVMHGVMRPEEVTEDAIREMAAKPLGDGTLSPELESYWTTSLRRYYKMLVDQSFFACQRQIRCKDIRHILFHPTLI